jgi:hypothetical protein
MSHTMTASHKCTKCSGFFREVEACAICHVEYCGKCGDLSAVDLDGLFEAHNFDDEDVDEVLAKCFDADCDKEDKKTKCYRPREEDVFCPKCFKKVYKDLEDLVKEQVALKGDEEEDEWEPDTALLENSTQDFCLDCSAKAEARLDLLAKKIESLLETTCGGCVVSEDKYEKYDFCPDCKRKFERMINTLEDKNTAFLVKNGIQIEALRKRRVDKKKKDETKAKEPPKKKAKL